MIREANCGTCVNYRAENDSQGFCCAELPIGKIINVHKDGSFRTISYFPPMKRAGWCAKHKPSDA